MSNLRLKIWQDSNAECPFEAWDCEPALMLKYGRNSSAIDYSKGDIADELRNSLTEEFLSKNAVQLCEIFEIDTIVYHESLTPEELLEAMQLDIENAIDTNTQNFEELEKLFDLLGVPNKRYTSTGHSQSDWSDVIIVLTSKFFSDTGCDPANSKKILEGTSKLFDDWAWGDVYGFTIEKREEYVKISREDFNEGNFISEAADLEEWVHEDSCGGFYGDDFETNGMKDYLPEELHEALKNYHYSDIEY